MNKSTNSGEKWYRGTLGFWLPLKKNSREGMRKATISEMFPFAKSFEVNAREF